jgi:hypothetical protein
MRAMARPLPPRQEGNWSMPTCFSIAGVSALRLLRAIGEFIWTRATVSARAVFNATRGEPAEEAMPSAFQPDVMLPVQYFEALRRKPFLEGEKLLAFTILKQAVDDYMRYLNSPRRKGQRRFREAEEWIDRKDRTWLFSFDNVCASLDIDPDYMRKGLHRWKLAHQRHSDNATQAG